MKLKHAKRRIRNCFSGGEIVSWTLQVQTGWWIFKWWVDVVTVPIPDNINDARNAIDPIRSVHGIIEHEKIHDKESLAAWSPYTLN